MKTSTLLILGGLGAAAIYALTRREELPEGGETTEPEQPTESTFDPHPEPGTQPGVMPSRGPGGLVG